MPSMEMFNDFPSSFCGVYFPQTDLELLTLGGQVVRHEYSLPLDGPVQSLGDGITHPTPSSLACQAGLVSVHTRVTHFMQGGSFSSQVACHFGEALLIRWVNTG